MGRDARFEGVFTAIITPFRQAGPIDIDGFRSLIHRQIEAGVAGLVVCGSTGEAATLEDSELADMVRTAKAQVGNTAMIIAGVSANSTQRAISLAKLYQTAGADALLVVTPFYNKPTQTGMEMHFRQVAAVTPLPIMIYNVPGRTAVNLLPETIERLTDVPMIASVKESSQNISQISDLIHRVGDELSILSGDDPFTLPTMALGARGVVSVSSNVSPGIVVELVRACLAGNLDRARELHFSLEPLTRALFTVSNPIPVKFMLSLMDIGDGSCRLPLMGLDDPHIQERLRLLLP